MMKIVTRLCALCAVSALVQLALGDTRGADGLRMIGGLLMVHLVICGGHELSVQLAEAKSLERIFAILMQ